MQRCLNNCSFLASYSKHDSPTSERRRSTLVTDVIKAERSLVNQQRRQSITGRKKSLASDVTITSPEQAVMNARRKSYTPISHVVCATVGYTVE